MTNNFHHLCIQTEKYEESLRFYVEVLGFKVKKVNAGFHGREYNTWLEAPSMMIELQTPKYGSSFQEWSQLNSGPVHIGLLVEDVEASYQHFVQKGHRDFRVKNGEVIYRVNGKTRLFKAVAPEGTEIEIRDSIEP